MKLMKTALIAQMIGIFLITQCYALTYSTRMTAQAVQFTMLLDHPESAAVFAHQVETQIDEKLSEVAQMDQTDEDDDADAETNRVALSDYSPRYARIQARWTKRMAKREPKLIQQYNDKIESLSDEALKTEVIQGQTALTENHPEMAQTLSLLANSADLKGELKKSYAEKIVNMTTFLPEQIAKAGGAFPFVLHLKKNLHALQNTLKTQQGNGFSLSNNNSVLCTIGVILAILIMIAGIIFSAVLFFGPTFMAASSLWLKIPLAIILTLVGGVISYGAGIGVDLLTCPSSSS